MTPFCIAASILTLLGFLVAAVLYPLRLFRPDLNYTRFAGWLLVIATGIQALALVVHGFHEDSGMFTARTNIVFLFVIFIVAGLLLVERKLDRPVMAAFVAPVLFLLVLFTLLRPGAGWPVSRPWLVAHIMLVILADACFALAFCLAMGYLVQAWCLKRKLVERLRLLPSLDVADDTAHALAVVGFSLFSLGLAIGIGTLVREHLGPDIKIGLATLTWLVYALYLVCRHGIGWRGRRLQALLVIGFCVALLNFLAARHQTDVLDTVGQPQAQVAPVEPGVSP